MPTTPATQITTTATVKSFIKMTDTSEDALISKMCDWVTNYIENYCAKNFVERTIEGEIYNTKDFKFSLFLNNTPIKEITSIEKKENNVWEALIEGEDYEVDLATGFLRFYTIGVGVGDLKISYVTGEVSVPLDLEMLATQMVARLIKKQGSQGVSQESLGEASIQWGAFTNDDDTKILNNHRRFTTII